MHFAIGSSGALIQRLRKSFGLKNVDRNGVSIPDSQTAEPMFQRFDEALRVKAGGVIDETRYASQLGDPFPEVFERALMVVGRLEGHGYFTTLTADRPKDPVGITMGIIGFQARDGKLGPLLADLVPSAPAELDTFLKDRAIEDEWERTAFREFLTMTNASREDRRGKAGEIFLRYPNKGESGYHVKEHWIAFFRRLLSTADAMAIQDRHARTNFWDKAVEASDRPYRAENAAEVNGLSSDLGKLLAFSICVNGGSLTDMKVPMSGTDRERRIEIAIRRSLKAPPGFEQRHIQLAKGFGFPNRIFVDASAWGFTPDPPPAAAQRILSLSFSSAPAMAALQDFEASAVSKGGFQERILENPRTRDLLNAAKVPTGGGGVPDFSRAWYKSLLSKDPPPTLGDSLRLLAHVDELPIDCLVLGGSISGNTLAGELQLVIQGGIISWKRDDLNLPFVPRMRNGVVVLFASAALPKFATRLQQAITRIDGSAPLVLGWTGSIKVFPGAKGPSCADAFFTQIRGKGKPLSELVATDSEFVIQAWGRACHATFAASEYPALWRSEGKLRKVLSACAALSANGTLRTASDDPSSGVFMKKQ